MSQAPRCLGRRPLVLGTIGAIAAFGVGACSRRDRCKACGMINEPASRFRVEIRGAAGRTERFDTPKCAFKAWRSGTEGELFAVGYYTQTMRPSHELSFVAGSDVLGPMGIDFIPVERELAKRFAAEHGAKNVYEAAAITLQVVTDLS